MGKKSDDREELNRILEEKFEYIKTTNDSLLGFEKTLSTTCNKKISMYNIKIFMKQKGYIYDKATNSWVNLGYTSEPAVEGTTSSEKQNHDFNDSPSNINTKSEEELNTHLNDLKDNISFDEKQSEINLNENTSITTELSAYLKGNSKKNKRKINAKKFEKNEGNQSEISDYKENSKLTESLDILPKVGSNFDDLVGYIESLLSENSALKSQLNCQENNLQNQLSKTTNITSEQMLRIHFGKKKRYELSLPIDFVQALRNKFLAEYPEIASDEQIKDLKLLEMILSNYLYSSS